MFKILNMFFTPDNPGNNIENAANFFAQTTIQKSIVQIDETNENVVTDTDQFLFSVAIEIHELLAAKHSNLSFPFNYYVEGYFGSGMESLWDMDTVLQRDDRGISSRKLAKELVPSSYKDALHHADESFLRFMTIIHTLKSDHNDENFIENFRKSGLDFIDNFYLYRQQIDPKRTILLNRRFIRFVYSITTLNHTNISKYLKQVLNK